MKCLVGALVCAFALLGAACGDGGSEQEGGGSGAPRSR